ncbi:MAG: iron-sulfur cluster assembly scaffold protein [Elusimicrobia bacterium]|nr:iron-sulfur cluster assembly scaffold protein [Elusimicrobiota bacterium]
MKNPGAVGMGASQVCGDVMTLYLAFDGDKVKDSSFKTMGCGAAIASGSILTEILKGKSVQEASSMGPDALVKALGGLPAIKMHCPELAIEALRAALKDYSHRQTS